MSEASPGFMVEPAAIINMIRENLVDRYRDAYSIVKELVQNSDDARATRIELGWCDGMGATARHPLLNGPALFVVNNGPFDHSNAKAIRRIYLSSKSNRRDSIGQFGLGMKSVFHVCEAFFYAWNTQDAGGTFAGAEVLNPWGGLCHSDWNSFCAEDQTLLRHRLASLRDGETTRDAGSRQDWFALWLPLRLPAHSEAGGDLIFERFYGASAEDAGIFDQGLLQDIPTLLPLLRHLEALRVWKVAGGDFERVFEAELRRPARRCGYREGMAVGASALDGAIAVHGASGIAAVDCTFSGMEAFVEDQSLRKLMDRPDWPRIETTDDRGMPAAVKRKAEPHGAVCFVRRAVPVSTRQSRGLTLRIRWAVFLPLQAEYDEIIPSGAEGPEDYTLTLHGWFFVDSGRQRIDLPVARHIGESEPNIRHDWNRRLMASATLPLVIPALDRLADSIGRSHPDLVELTHSLMESALFSEHRRSICSGLQWVMAFDRAGATWKAMGEDAPVLVMPGGVEDRDTAWRTFGSLDDLSRRKTVTFEKAPRLSGGHDAAGWSLDEIVGLLRVNVSTMCRDAEALNYCASFVSSFPGQTINSERVQATLVSIVRGALHTVGTGVYMEEGNKALRRAMSRLIELVDASRIVGVSRPRGLEGAVEEVLTKLAGVERGLLALPCELMESREPNAVRSIADGTILLSAIGALQESIEREYPTRTPALWRACAWIARTVLVGASEDAFGEIVRGIDALGLFPAATFRSESVGRRLSIGDIRSSHSGGELFSGVPRYARALQATIPGLELYGLDLSGVAVVDEALQVRLLDDGRIPPCDLRMCVRLLCAAKGLTADAECRFRLFEALVKDDPDQSDSALIACLRYLLHGRPGLFNRELEQRTYSEVLFFEDDDQGSAWRVLVDAITNQRGEQWRRLPSEVCRKLNGEQLQRLGMSRIERGVVMSLLDAMEPAERRAIGVEDEDARRQLLRSWPESHLHLLRDLALHRQTGTKKLVALDEHTFLRGSYQLPHELGGALSITLVEPNPEYEYWAQRGTPLAETFGLDQALREVLLAPEPQRYWKFVLDAVDRLGMSCSDDSIVQVETTPWVPLRTGRIVSPRAVLSIPAMDALLPELVGSDTPWAAWRDVQEEVSKHRASPSVIQRCLAVDDAGRALCELLGRREAFQIGEVGLDDGACFDVWVAALRAETSAMPAARVVAGLVEDLGQERTRSLVTELLTTGVLTAERLQAVLVAFRAHHVGLPTEARGAAVTVHNEYLRLVARHPHGVSCLKTVHLLNQQGKWTPSAGLCMDSPGVSKAALLEPEQEVIVRACLGTRAPAEHPAGIPVRGGELSAGEVVTDELERTLQNSAKQLEQYFTDWSRRISSNAIGGFFAFLGDHAAMVDLAGKYLRPRSVNELRHRVPWLLPVVLHNDGTKGTRPEKDTVDAQMRNRRFIIEVVDEKTTVVPNLFGESIRVSLSQDIEHIVLHHSTAWLGGESWLGVTRLQLRRVPQEQLREPHRARELMEKSLAWLLENIFRQRPNEEALAEIVDPDRDLGALNIRIVQNILLDALPVYLQQISYRGSGEVREYLDRWNRATYAAAEAELELEKPGGRHVEARGALERAVKEHRQLRESLRQVLLDDSGFQREILDSVRRKMHVAQYSASAVPFELFQNADDAVSEWGRMRGDSAPLSAAHRRFVIVQGPEAVTFVHWGRPVNRSRLGQFDGSTRRYQDDLLKMLTIAASDKSAEESRTITTGRYGYGFKSTFFLSADPWVISGMLGVRVVAGFYPDDLSDDALRSVLEASERWQDPMLEGDDATAVHLRYDRTDERTANYFDRFTRMMPLLPVFGREINRVVLQRSDGSVRHASWNPWPIAGVRGAWVGTVSLPVVHGQSRGLPAEQDTQCLVLEAGPREASSRCELLLVVESSGIARLADEVPTIWVTAPTKECCGLGFAFNGPFDLHIARESLAPDSATNDSIVRDCGERLGEVLVELFDKGIADWEVLREELKLGADAHQYGFWQTVWQRLGESVSETSGSSHAGRLMRELFWGVGGAMRTLVGRRAALPTGLPDTDPMNADTSYARLVRFDEPEQIVEGRLAEENVFLEVGYWKRFSEKWTPGKVLHPEVGATLTRLMGSRAPTLGQLRLVDVLENELDAGLCAPPSVAAGVGSLISPEFVRQSPERDGRTAVDEDNRLAELLELVKFRARDGGWHPAGTLVVGHDGSDGRIEDRRRAALAPPDNVLDSGYDAAALRFFYACRYYGPGVKAETIARWIARDTLSDEQRRAALEYLAKSSDADRVGQCLRELGPTWLSEMSRGHALFQGMTQQDVAMALQRGGAWEWDQFVRGEYRPAEPEETDQERLPEDALLRIAAWWRRHGESHLAGYYQRLFLDGRRPELFVGEVRDDPPVLEAGGIERRRGWMTLLLLGAMQTMGRTRPEQHRGFVQRCLSRGWLDTFATPPHQDAERWLGLLNEYFDPQLDDQEYLHWMSLYPRVYQFGHWLHQYVWWFKILDHQERLTIHDLLNPRVSQLAQRTEIDAPPLSRALGIGMCLVVRELIRAGFLLRSEQWARFCYMPVARVRTLARRLRLCDLEEEVASGGRRIEHSEALHAALARTLRDPTFGGAYDIPLQLVAEDAALLEEAMRESPLSER